MKRIITVLLCLLLVSLGIQAAYATTSGLAAPDPAFAAYGAAVKGLSGENQEDMHKAAQAFIAYLQVAVKADTKLLLAHVEDPLMVQGKHMKKEVVAQKVDTVLNDVVVQCVQQSDATGDVFVRNMAEYMVGDGCIWFTFTDDDPAKPSIFAVNNVTTQ